MRRSASLLGRVALPVLVAAATGCFGGGDDDGGGGGDSVDPLDGPYGDVLIALCETLERCPELTAEFPLTYRDVRECAAILGFVFTCDVEEIGDTRTYELIQTIPDVSEAQAAACVAWLEAATCSQLLAGDELGDASPCAGLLVESDDGGGGSLQLGDACGSGACASGLYCPESRYDEATGQPTCRTCTALPAAGEPCTSYTACAAGLFCSYASGMPLCAPLVADGGDCGDSNGCASGFCNPNTQKCDGGGRLGDACADTYDCRDGWCDAQACAARKPGYAACADDLECANYACDDTAGICGRPDGTTCQSFESSQCASGYCDPAIGQCAPPRPDGSACENHNECASGYCDVFSSQTCIDHCYSDDECPGDQFCNWDTERCQDPGPDGSYCEEHAHCLSGNCRFASQTCGPPPTLGGSCQSNEDCRPIGNCQEGTCVAKPGPGEACQGFDSCGEPYLCSQGRCTLMNLACEPASPGELCAWLRVCDQHSYCDQAGGFRCVRRVGEGAECFQDTMCSAGLRCDLQDPGGPRCRPRVPAGGACTASAECIEDHYCIDGVCGAGPQGRPCDEYDFPCPVGSGLFCDRDAGETCQPPNQLGEDCDEYDSPCEAGLYCDSSAGCMAPGTVGASCDNQHPCAAGLYCEDQMYTCAEGVALGQPCSDFYPRIGCAAGLRCEYDSMVGDYLCQPALQAGEDCSDDGDCASGICHFDFGCLASDVCVAAGG